MKLFWMMTDLLAWPDTKQLPKNELILRVEDEVSRKINNKRRKEDMSGIIIKEHYMLE